MNRVYHSGPERVRRWAALFAFPTETCVTA